MNLLEMQHVKKGFGENEVLKDISLSVAEGEVVSIIDLLVPENPPCCDARHC